MDQALASPLGRSRDLVITASGDDLVVYDEKSHQIHQLNVAAAAVWRACDGARSLQKIAQKTRLANEDVAMALAQLQTAGLLEHPLPVVMIGGRGSRRSFLRKAGAAGVALAPVVISITAPAAAQTQSCAPSMTPCDFGDPGACCSRACIVAPAGPVCV